MKFAAIRFREKTTEFFGKKWMSWHGAVIFYKSICSDTERVNVTSVTNPTNVQARDELSTLFSTIYSATI